MIALARLGSFGFAYITIFIISNLVAETHKESDIVFLENFHAVSYSIVTLALIGWLYFTHYKDKEVPRDLKEMLYIFTFVCGFTSLAGILGYC